MGVECYEKKRNIKDCGYGGGKEEGEDSRWHKKGQQMKKHEAGDKSDVGVGELTTNRQRTPRSLHATSPVRVIITTATKTQTRRRKFRFNGAVVALHCSASSLTVSYTLTYA